MKLILLYLLILKGKITGQTGNNCKKDVEIIMSLKYLTNFWRTLEMPIINGEINFILTWSDNCVIVSTVNENLGAAFSITDTKLYVRVVTLSTEDNAKLIQQLKWGFKRRISWNKHQLRISIERLNQYLDYIIDPSFQGANGLFILSIVTIDIFFHL